MLRSLLLEEQWVDWRWEKKRVLHQQRIEKQLRKKVRARVRAKVRVKELLMVLMGRVWFGRRNLTIGKLPPHVV